LVGTEWGGGDKWGEVNSEDLGTPGVTPARNRQGKKQEKRKSWNAAWKIFGLRDYGLIKILRGTGATIQEGGGGEKSNFPWLQGAKQVFETGRFYGKGAHEGKG